MIRLFSLSLNWGLISDQSSLVAAVFIFLLAATVAMIAWRTRNAPIEMPSEPASFTSKDLSAGALTILQALESSAEFRLGRVGLNLMSMIVALMAFALLMTGLKAEAHHPDSFDLRDVHVIERIDDYNFVLDVQPKDKSDRVRFALTACQDFMPTHEIQAGVNLKWLGYVEDRAHHCDELDGPEAGYALERDRHNAPVIHDWTSYAGSSAPSYGTYQAAARTR